jgi:hypothetical protein
MGITISGPSTQIPTNVVEVGNEITQNQLNAITASNLPSTGNPLQTLSAVQTYVGNNVSPILSQKVDRAAVGWSHPFPIGGNFVLVFHHATNQWWPWNTAGTVLHSQVSGTNQNSYNFDFHDWNGSFFSLSGNPDVGASYTNYNALGYWDNVNGTTFSISTGTSYYSASGPSYAGNWDNPVGASSQFYDGMSWYYRYVYLDGNGGFYTADNMNNPPY